MVSERFPISPDIEENWDKGNSRDTSNITSVVFSQSASRKQEGSEALGWLHHMSFQNQIVASELKDPI